MKDHGYQFRQYIIHGPEAKRRHYQELISRGLSFEDAVNMSGYNPHEEMGAMLASFIKWAAVVVICVGLLVLISRSEVMARELEGAKRSEAALIKCVNGGVFLLGNEGFYCTSVGDK